jgi:hypothetical protein
MPTDDRPALHLRTATAADRDAILALLAEEAAAAQDSPTGHAPPPLPDPAAHDWLYWDNPYGRPHVVVWEDADRIVAHVGLYPGLGRVEGRVIRIGRMAHVATARGYRGRGLYGSLVRRLRDLAAGDLDLIVALPTPAAVPGLEGAGVMRRDRAQRWFRPIGEDFADLRGVPRPLAATFTRVAFGPPPDPGGEVLEALPDDVDDLAAADAVDGPLADGDWWRWRFAGHPVHRYDLVRTAGPDGRTTALVATRATGQAGARFLQVLHWQATGVDAAAAALGTALRHSSGCVAATLLATDGTEVAEWARRCGMRRLPSILDDTSGQIALAATGPAATLPGRHWSVSLASHHDR